MKFFVCDKGEAISTTKGNVYLKRDNWDDFSFKTTFNVTYCYENGRTDYIGQIKIGKVGMEDGRVFDLIPKQFDRLESDFFSLGQDENFYVNVSKLGEENSIYFFTSLRDVAYDLNLFSSVRTEPVLNSSLMRSVSVFSVIEQFNRIANGGAILTKYNFSSTIANSSETFQEQSQINFEVDPGSNPPTNVHVLIGRNGTGKTTLIKNLIYSIRHNDDTHGTFDYVKIGRLSSRAKFANVLCVAFSPFDDFSEESEIESEIPYSYIGLDKHSGNLLQAIEDQFC